MNMNLNNRVVTVKVNFLNEYMLYRCTIVDWKHNLCKQCNLRYKCLTTAEDDIVEIDINTPSSAPSNMFILEQIMFNRVLNLENLAKTNIQILNKYGVK